MGGFAEYEYVIPRTEVAKIPEELTDEEVIGADCAFRSVVAAYERLGRIDIQDDVLIQGAGPIGLYALAQAIESGAGKAIVVGAPRARLDLAKRWGADYIINIDEITDPSKRKDQILELTSGRGPDIVVDCTGVPAAFSEGVKIIRRGGRYLVIGQLSEATTTFTPGKIVSMGLDIIGNIPDNVHNFRWNKLSGRIFDLSLDPIQLRLGEGPGPAIIPSCAEVEATEKSGEVTSPLSSLALY